MSFKRTWNYIVAHNVWNKVAANAIWWTLTLIAGGIVYIYSHTNNINLFGILGSFFSLKLPLWICLISIIVTIALTLIVRKDRHKRNAASITPEPGPTTLPSIAPNPRIISKIVENLIFDSNMTDQSWWNGYGQQNWDEAKKQLSGDRGVGDWHFKEHILTVARDNTAGQFVVAIKTYMSRGNIVNFIPANFAGKNPRNFRVKFSARVFSGKHKVIIVFRKKDGTEWFNRVPFEIANAKWEPLLTGMAIKADEDFLIELHTWSYEAKTRFQIKDFIVEET